MRGPDRRKVTAERRLRRKSTDAEMVLWLSLRDRRLCGYKFVRQEAIESFVVDFVCRDKKFVIEVDGGQHAESAGDQVRDEALRVAGYQVLRFWNSDVLKNKNGVLEVIANALSGINC
jgi:very-short-patch-repair endonuclease